MWKSDAPLAKFGSLQAVDFPSVKPATIVLCHGYGADCYDLVPLREELGLSEQARWVFPQAPSQVEIGPGFWGRAWFPVDLNRDPATYPERRAPGVNEARDQLLSLIRKLGVPLDQLILGGFSQGAMMALEAALTLPTPPRGLILLSGTLADREGLRARAPLKKGQPFFQSHGEMDQILPFSGAEQLFEELNRAGWNGVWCPFRGGHEIPGPVLRNLKSYLMSLLGTK